jgi:hypothetical protein
MRDFEDYGWRDLVDDEVRHIYSPYLRERGVGKQPGLVVVHPAKAVADLKWQGAALALVAEARRKGIPVVHSVVPGAAATPGFALRKEPVCLRPCESAFFSSDLERVLKTVGAASLVLCGAPTSAALRATAVEGKSFGYKVAIAEEAAGDDTDFLHKMALFDVAHKYADVMSLEELVERL